MEDSHSLEEILGDWDNCCALLPKYPKEAARNLRPIFECLVKRRHKEMGFAPPEKKEGVKHTPLISFIKEIKDKRIRKEAFRLNKTLNGFAHDVDVNEEKIVPAIESMIGVARDFGVDLPWASPVEKEFFAKYNKINQESPSSVSEEGGGFGDHPDQCPHCENYIGYLRGSAPKHFGPSSMNGRGSFGWLAKHDRNYCPFCLFEEWLPEYKKWGMNEGGLVSKDIEYIERELDSIIRVNSIDINNPEEFQRWWNDAIHENYHYNESIADLDNVIESTYGSRTPHSEEEALGRHVLRIFEASGKNSMNIIDFRKLWETGLFGYAKDGHEIKWDPSDGYLQPRGIKIDGCIQGVPREWSSVIEYLRHRVDLIPKMYSSFLDFRVVPFNSTSVSIDVIPNNKIRRGEEIDLEEIVKRGVHKILYDVFTREGDPLFWRLTSDEIIDGIWELKYALVTDVEDYHDLENLSIEEQLDLIPEYCKNHLSSEIADGKVYWTLNGRLNSTQLDTDENKGVRK